jgi:hypothetical protein
MPDENAKKSELVVLFGGSLERSDAPLPEFLRTSGRRVLLPDAGGVRSFPGTLQPNGPTRPDDFDPRTPQPDDTGSLERFDPTASNESFDLIDRIEGDNANDLQNKFTSLLPLVATGTLRAAYIKPPLECLWSRDVSRPGVDTPPLDFRALQTYLDGAAKSGVNFSAVKHREIDGTGITIADVEGAWNPDHEDLQLLDGQRGDLHKVQVWRNHGTCVLGVLVAKADKRGVTGMVPKARVVLGSISENGNGSAGTLSAVVKQLNAGDVLLIELQREYPGRSSRPIPGRRDEWIPIEWWPDDFEVIRRATEKGIVVVEAAGNSGLDLDDARYDDADNGFPSDWRNPLNLKNHPAWDSGAILVGAGIADRESSPGRKDASRHPCSNYGPRVDVQAWGDNVATTGGGGLYGVLQGSSPTPIPETQWYEWGFSGTSAASAIVAGVVCCMQQYAQRVLKRPLLPSEVRSMLRDDQNGTAQSDDDDRPRTQRVGPRPDLEKLFNAIERLNQS